MAGTKEGYQKWRAKMVAELGGEAQFAEWRRRNGAKGGAISGPTSPTNFANNRKLAKRAGSVKRTNVDQPDSVRAGQYKNEGAQELQ